MKASVGPWNSSSSHSFGPIWRSGAISSVIEPGVGRLDQLAELGLAQIGADERRQHPRRDLLIRGAPQRLEPVPLEPRPGLGQIQPAVGGEAGEQRRLEATGRHAAARADVAKGHGRNR